MIEYVERHEIETIADFAAWQGGKSRLDDICNSGDEVINLVNGWVSEMCASDDTVTDSDINDFLWFEAPEVLANAGYELETANGIDMYVSKCE